MPSRHAESLFLVVLVVPASLLAAGTSLKAIAISLALFAVCLLVFFYPSISDYLRRQRQQRND